MSIFLPSNTETHPAAYLMTVAGSEITRYLAVPLTITKQRETGLNLTLHQAHDT